MYMKFFVLILFSLLFSCQNQKVMNKTNTPEKFSRIDYHFSDSSVPPPYHRSYSISLKPESIHIVVDSYGDILTDTSMAFSTENFNTICDSFASFNIKTCEKTDSEGCTGGTGEQLIMFNEASEKIISGSVYYCGGESFGTLKGDVKGFSKLIKEFVPNLSDLLKR